MVRDCRSIGKKDMKYNGLMPKMKVDPETYVSSLITFDDGCTDAKGCKSSWLKPTEWHVKRTLPQNCRWRRRTMSIELVK